MSARFISAWLDTLAYRAGVTRGELAEMRAEEVMRRIRLRFVH